MLEDNKTAIILGASGLVGSFLLDILLKSDNYKKIIVLVRKHLDKEHPKLIQHIIDFEKEQTYKDLVHGDDLFCCLGTTIKEAGTQSAFKKVDFEYPVSFAQIAKQNGIKRYLLVSSIGADSNSSVFYLRTKGEGEDSIKNIGLTSLSVFRPASLVGKRTKPRLSENLTVVILKIFSIFLFGKFKKYKPISAHQVAKAMYLVAQKSAIGYTVYESDEIATIR